MPNPQADDVIGQYSSSGWTLPTLTGQGGSLTGRPTDMPSSPVIGFPEMGVGANGGVGGVTSPGDPLQKMLDQNAGAANPFSAFPNGAQAWQDYQAGKYGAPNGTDSLANNNWNGAGSFERLAANPSGFGFPSSGPQSDTRGRQGTTPFGGGLGVGGGVGSSPFSRTLGGGAGNGNGLGGGAPKPQTQRDVFQQQLDQKFGQGWSANFTAQNGLDPISFYEREVPAHITDPAERASIAMQRAGNDAQYHPNEIQDWQQKHGNTPIPDEQWRIWSRINQGGGPDYGAGRGVDPYGVH